MTATTVMGAAWGCWVGSWVWIATRPHRSVHPPVAPRTVSPAASRPGPCGHLQTIGNLPLVGISLGLGAGVLFHPLLGPIPLLVAWAWPRLQDRRRAQRAVAAVVEQLPDVIELLRLTTLAGLPVSASLRAIGDRPGGPVGAAFEHAAQRLNHGATTAQALDVLEQACGAPARPLVDALKDHDRYGTPLTPALDRVGIESRMQRRRQAEEAVRRLPVTLLFPLVLTTLPASALLTVVPLLVASLSSLQP